MSTAESDSLIRWFVAVTGALISWPALGFATFLYLGFTERGQFLVRAISRRFRGLRAFGVAIPPDRSKRQQAANEFDEDRLELRKNAKKQYDKLVPQKVLAKELEEAAERIPQLINAKGFRCTLYVDDYLFAD